jgi:acyl carrier protein
MNRRVTDARSVLKSFIAQELARDRPELDVETEPLVESGVIDSVGIMKLVAFMEKALKLKIEDDELIPEHFETLDALCLLVENKRAR